METRKSSKKVQALGLCSGGLDSILAALVLRDQGIHVEWINFETPFFSSEKATRAARQTGVPLTVMDITAEHLKMLKDPNCGYGKQMNPCLDCHALMYRIAGQVMEDRGFDFLFSGEVLGQRPMSQTKSSLRYVEKNSGREGYILRPLSAGNLPETIPEKEGLVDRARLLDLSGRSRKPQMELAKRFQLSEYPAPAGGCLLTDKHFSIRLRDLFEHQDEYAENELHLLKYGRHFRLTASVKLVVGRAQSENDQILQLYDPSAHQLIKVRKYAGPISLLLGDTAGHEDICMLAASIAAGYSKAPALTPVEVDLKRFGERRTVRVLAMPPSDVKKFLI